MEIKILYDNEVAIDTGNMIPAHGFSCIIEENKEKVLFDTGWDSRILFNNASRLDIDLMSIKKIVISHAHWDHMGSLLSLLPFEEKSDKKVYFPSASKTLRKELEKRAEVVTDNEPIEVIKDVYTTGLMGKDIKELALVIKGDEGLVIVTGCAHPGVKNILERTRELFGEDIYALIGGLHDFNELDILKEIKLIVPCHCTVEKERILRNFNSLRCGVGVEIEI